MISLVCENFWEKRRTVLGELPLQAREMLKWCLRRLLGVLNRIGVFVQELLSVMNGDNLEFIDLTYGATGDKIQLLICLSSLFSVQGTIPCRLSEVIVEY